MGGAIVSIRGLEIEGCAEFIALEEEVRVFFDLNGRVWGERIAPNLRERAAFFASMC